MTFSLRNFICRWRRPDSRSGARPALRTFLSVMLLSLWITPVASQAGVPVPDVPKGEGKQCVEPTDVMRKNHMEFLEHQRDETVHRGIRTKKHSLKECFTCHTVKDDDGQPVGYEDPRHFCNSCHSYAAVEIDCFECHASKPESKMTRASHEQARR